MMITKSKEIQYTGAINEARRRKLLSKIKADVLSSTDWWVRSEKESRLLFKTPRSYNTGGETVEIYLRDSCAIITNSSWSFRLVQHKRNIDLMRTIVINGINNLYGNRDSPHEVYSDQRLDTLGLARSADMKSSLYVLLGVGAFFLIGYMGYMQAEAEETKRMDLAISTYNDLHICVEFYYSYKDESTRFYPDIPASTIRKNVEEKIKGWEVHLRNIQPYMDNNFTHNEKIKLTYSAQKYGFDLWNRAKEQGELPHDELSRICNVGSAKFDAKVITILY